LQTKAPAKKTVVAKPALKPSKPPAKPKAVPKKKVLVDKDDNADRSAVDVDEVVDSGNESAGSSKTKAPAPPKKNKTASETYTKVRRLECQRSIANNRNLAVISTRAYFETS
jgi:DNA topoisomerase-2